MSKRGWLVVAILAVWASTLGFHVKRLYFRPMSALLADAARTIPPGTAYYAVFQGDRRIGWAQTDIDTLPKAGGFLLEDQLIIREPLLPGGEPMRLSIQATLGPTFNLRRFVLDATGVPGLRTVEGEVRGDSVLELAFRGVGETRRETVSLEGPIVVAAAWPLRFAAQREVVTGESFSLDTYDPLTGSRRAVQLSVLEERVRSYPDSVTAVDGYWIPARRDTVRAWRVMHDVSGIELEAWVDEDGRLLEASAVGGIRLVRTAFELAFFGERVPDQLFGVRPGSDRERAREAEGSGGGESAAPPGRGRN
jgi:hypothetical protein